jgi:hypothetical protein
LDGASELYSAQRDGCSNWQFAELKSAFRLAEPVASCGISCATRQDAEAAWAMTFYFGLRRAAMELNDGTAARRVEETGNVVGGCVCWDAESL